MSCRVKTSVSYGSQVGDVTGVPSERSPTGTQEDDEDDKENEVCGSGEAEEHRVQPLYGISVVPVSCILEDRGERTRYGAKSMNVTLVRLCYPVRKCHFIDNAS